jgi:hypothetical protein
MSDVRIIWENIFMKLVKTILSTAVVAMAMGGAVVLNPILARATDNPNTVSCVKGEVKQDFTGEWTSRNTVKFSTADGKKLCKDVDVFVSSYVMPDNYNGEKFWNNPTATPQTMFASKKITLKAGTTGATVTTINVPSVCKNIQVDAYLGPELKVVGPEGHDGRAFATAIYKKTVDSCETPKVDTCNTETGKVVKVEKGNENKAPYSTDFTKCEDKPAPVKEEEKETPAELPHTGVNLGVLSALPISLAVAAGVAYAQKRQ